MNYNEHNLIKIETNFNDIEYFSCAICNNEFVYYKNIDFFVNSIL